MRKPINYIITNLALADFARSLETGMMATPSNAVGYIYLGKTQCQMDGFFVAYLGTLIFITG